MSSADTVRARVARASAFFDRLEAVVLTTFNLDASFLEENALPAIFGVDASTPAARRAELHRRLGECACTVFFDPISKPKLTGRFRYVARPVPLRGRFFHPKLVVLAGAAEDGTNWVYVAASSANLTLSGWGRNAESFGDTWIHTPQQPSWEALRDLLRWLAGRHVKLGEEPDRSDAVRRVRDVLDRMPDRRRFNDDGTAPWSGTLYARLYASPIHRDGLAAFLREGRQRSPTALAVYSPYWADVKTRLAAFEARDVALYPALRERDGLVTGLAAADAEQLEPSVSIRRNEQDGDRFWHLKAYRISFGDVTYTAVGSCNFTQAGLVGATGNVEAMLVHEDDGAWLPGGGELDRKLLADEPEPEERAPKPTPLAVVVAWDWRARHYRWWLDAGRDQREVVLRLPGTNPIPTPNGTHAAAGPPPPRGATFTVSWSESGRPESWDGPIVELNLDHSTRSFGRPLTATEILDSWRGRTPGWGLGGGGGAGEGGEEDDSTAASPPAAFDAVNLYDLYRSIAALRVRLAELAEKPELQRPYLVGRPNSVVSLARLASGTSEVPVIRFAVLTELVALVRPWRKALDATLFAELERAEAEARVRVLALVRDEVGDASRATRMLGWFEDRLRELDRGIG